MGAYAMVVFGGRCLGVGQMSDHWDSKMYQRHNIVNLVMVAANLECSGISLNMENSGNSLQPHGKIVTNKVVLVRHSDICVKQLLTG